jgi:hypothetical protein
MLENMFLSIKLHNAKIGINKNYKNGTEFIIDFEL